MINSIDTLTSKTINWQGLTITDNAAIQIKKLMREKFTGKNQGLIITIKQSGCAGFSYLMKIVANLSKEEYLLFENNGAKLFVAVNVMPFIDGTEIDYVYEGLNQLFKFNNPKAQYICGCGKSFGISAN